MVKLNGAKILCIRLRSGWDGNTNISSLTVEKAQSASNGIVTEPYCLRPALCPFRKEKLRIRIVIYMRTETYGREGVFAPFPPMREKQVQPPLRRNLHGERLNIFSLYGKIKRGKDFMYFVAFRSR